jgi:hypothetical protein
VPYGARKEVLLQSHGEPTILHRTHSSGDRNLPDLERSRKAEQPTFASISNISLFKPFYGSEFALGV